ncbi:unnamed protein product [Colletotrichum noveboracense]|uniref:SnoaL-like domain-containing protein n=1 Tax=Colletotrichum noveboracense TaxID=2664923 RepID=A0A9W4WMZ7_9PEZI|nr:unnamed protein product [Colletotrichum noveboracense]
MSATETQQILPPALQTLVDKEEIRSGIYRFARGSDRGIRDLVQSVFHPDATDNHGFYNGPAKDMYNALNAGPSPDAAHHHIGQSLIELGDDGITAAAETYCIATTVNVVDGKDKWVTFLVRYIDTFEKREGEWKIKDRVLAFDGVSDGNVLKSLPKESLGRRDENDYSRKVMKN